MLDNNTFGNSRGAKVLTDKLKSHLPKMTKHIGDTLSNYGRELNQLKKLDSRIAIKLSRFLFHQLIDNINNNQNPNKYPEDIKTYLCNVIHTINKEFLVKMDSQKPYKKRPDNPNKKG